MLLWGATAFLATLVPKNLADDVGRRLSAFLLGAAIVAMATTVAALPVETSVIGSGWSDATSLTTLEAVLFETSVGQAWQLQMVAALLVLAALLFSRHLRPRALAFASALVLVSLALTGHAVMHAGWLGAAHRINDALHVLSAGGWLGALVPLLVILAGPDRLEWRNAAGIVLDRFSTAGHIAVAAVIASGIVNTLLVLGHWPADWSSPYQAMLAAKIVVAAAMIGIALINRYALVPRIVASRQGPLKAIRLGVAGEIALGLFAVGLVSVFGMLEPV
jgi:putative copper resistance protein D